MGCLHHTSSTRGQGAKWKRRQKGCKSQRWWRIIRKQGLSGSTELISIWTHRDYWTMYKACICSSQMWSKYWEDYLITIIHKSISCGRPDDIFFIQLPILKILKWNYCYSSDERVGIRLIQSNTQKHGCDVTLGAILLSISASHS